MKFLSLLLIVAVLGTTVFLGFYFYSRLQRYEVPSQAGNEIVPEATECVPTFADGGGPYYKPTAPFREVLVDEGADGEPLTVRGKILLNDCKTPVTNAVLDIWQANASGSYEDEWYRGKVRTDDEGNYAFTTVVPKGYGEGTGYRPPHIHFKVFVNDTEIITSQMFFPEVKGREGFNDAYIMELESTTTANGKHHKGYHDIILPLSSI